MTGRSGILFGLIIGFAFGFAAGILYVDRLLS